MDFSNTSTLAGMIQECERGIFSSDYGRISGNTTLLKEFTNYLNQGLDEVTIKILQADNTWEFDDSEYTDFPIATTDVNADQDDYALAVTHMIIKRVEIKDEAGKWLKLDPFDQRQTGRAIEELRETSGKPQFYDIYQNSIRIFPAADYTSSDSLKIYFQRPMDYFETSDTTKRPGFAPIFQKLVPMWANYFYASYHQMPVANSMRADITLKERDLQKFFRARHEDMPKRIVPRYKSSR